MAAKKSRRQKSRRPPPPGEGAKVLPRPVAEPRQRGRLFWICTLVLIEALVWSAASVVTSSGTVQLLLALAVGAVMVVVLRERIWGTDWREEIARSRARRPR
ncbi:hypothetical protein AB0L40_00965 [Patulibacter sp. NPDC049589]|uniref:hypothetical protein n=1 Tax=Patulibacter sp. NPDC049589 TaxID=3154731 RepID=UPI00342AB82A